MRNHRRFSKDFREILRTIENTSEFGTCFTPRLLELVLVLEDKRFAYHIGIDPIATIRAAVKLLVGRPRGGASTIDMQLVRTLTGYRDKTIRRKLYESALAIAVRFSTPADNILNTYLKVAYLGTGITGIDEAASKMFGRPISDLSVMETSKLAALLVYPMPKNINAAWEEKVERRARYGVFKRNRIRLFLGSR